MVLVYLFFFFFLFFFLSVWDRISKIRLVTPCLLLIANVCSILILQFYLVNNILENICYQLDTSISS
jgi:hypothetical protein